MNNKITLEFEVGLAKSILDQLEKIKVEVKGNVACLDLLKRRFRRALGNDRSGQVMEEIVLCECGASSVRSPIHSKWCPKYKG